MSAVTADAVVDASVGVADPILTASHVTLRFGGVTSLNDVSIAIPRAEIMAVIGPNGAGKTSLFNCLTGVYVPQNGEIEFRPSSGGERRIHGQKPYTVNQYGIARTFQNIRLFNALTALENVKIGVESRQRTGPIGAMLGLPWARREERDSDRRALQLLEFVGLLPRANTISASLAYGEQRRLEIARALGTGPELLLLDEPAAGTNPSEKNDLEQLIRRIQTELRVTVLLIEHDMKLVMAVARRIAVLNFGRVISVGRPEEVQRDPAVIAAYLGGTPDEPGTPPPPEVAAAPGGDQRVLLEKRDEPGATRA